MLVKSSPTSETLPLAGSITTSVPSSDSRSASAVLLAPPWGWTVRSTIQAACCWNWSNWKQSPTVQFLQQRIDMRQLTAESDAGIFNGSNGAVYAMLMAGKPVFNIPRYVEQVIYSERVNALGAGLSALPSRPERIGSRLVTLLNEPGFAAAANGFAGKYSDSCPTHRLQQTLRHIDSLLA